MVKKVSIVAIGTEITTGQICDTNSQWLSNQLTDQNFDVHIHLSVADDLNDMLDALRFCEKKSELIIVTGGLGPTSDDKTRDAIAQWSQTELIYDSGSWDHISRRMATLNIEPAESNRQQCFFPKGSQILVNEAGTANAFWVSKPVDCICLPGPPREIKHIFRNGLQEKLQNIRPSGRSTQLFRWHALGKSEADLGEIVEQQINGSSLVSGYRPHRPYVEIKIWSPRDDLERNQSYLDKLDQALKPWTITKNDDDIASLFLNQLQGLKLVHFKDCATSGALTERLRRAQRRLTSDSAMPLHIECMTPEQPLAPSSPENEDQVFRGWISSPNQDGSWEVHWSYKGSNHNKTLSVPFARNSTSRERLAPYICELSIIEWFRAIEPSA